MKYDHIVVAYGKYYAAGEEVPEIDPRELRLEDDDLVAGSADETVAEPATKRRGRPKSTQQ